MDAGWLTPDQWENPDKEGALYHISTRLPRLPDSSHPHYYRNIPHFVHILSVRLLRILVRREPCHLLAKSQIVDFIP